MYSEREIWTHLLMRYLSITNTQIYTQWSTSILWEKFRANWRTVEPAFHPGWHTVVCVLVFVPGPCKSLHSTVPTNQSEAEWQVWMFFLFFSALPRLLEESKKQLGSNAQPWAWLGFWVPCQKFSLEDFNCINVKRTRKKSLTLLLMHLTDCLVVFLF